MSDIAVSFGVVCFVRIDSYPLMSLNEAPVKYFAVMRRSLTTGYNLQNN